MQSLPIVDEVIARLEKASHADPEMAPLNWRYAPDAPADPLHVVVAEDWPVWEQAMSSSLRINKPNWFYADLVFPERYNGVALADSPVRLEIYGYCPFTLWIDGKQLYEETHVWHATGPLFDEIALRIVPGRVHKLIACFEPTELPVGLHTAEGIHFQAARWQDISTDLGAAALELRIACGFANDDEEHALVAAAAALVDTAALDANDWDGVMQSINRMEEALLPFSARAKAMTVHLVGHTHIDMDWMWTWKDTEYCIRRDAKSVIEMMDDFPELTFTISQVPFYDTVRTKDPEVFARIQQRVAEGRWECVAGTWVEGDLNMADGESIARHMLYAKDWTREHLGVESSTLWEPDTFGHPGNMPQLAKLGEMQQYFHWRCNPGRDKNWPARIWSGVDGTPIVAFSEAYGGHLAPGSILGNVLNYQQWGLTHVLHIWGLGDHGGGMPRYFLSVLERYRHRPLIPQFKFDTMAGFTEAILQEREKFPTNAGETFSLFEGCFTTHAMIKTYNRRCETALLTAEALSALARLDRRAQLREAWTSMLFNHFHDIFDGASVHGSYDNAYARAESSLAAADEVQQHALQTLLTPVADGSRLTLINPLGCSRCEPVCVALPETVVAVRDAAGKVMPVQRRDDCAVFIAEDVPAFSRKSYALLTTVPEEVDVRPVQVAEHGAYYRVETAYAVSQIHRESGVIGSYFDKELDEEFVAYGVNKTLTHVPCTRKELALNVFQIIDESPNRMPAWLINDVVKEESLLRGGEVTLLEQGPVFARFRVNHAFRNSTITEDIIYYRDFPRIDFRADIDWRERGNDEVGVPQLKVSFGAAVRAARARFDGPFFVPERTADGTEQVTQKYVDISGDAFGFTLLNDSRYGVDALGGRARLTLLRNPYNPDPETDNGRHVVQFAFAPHGAQMSTAALQRMGMAYNRPPVGTVTDGDVDEYAANLTIEGNDDIVCTCLRLAEHSDALLVRLFNTTDARVTTSVTLGGGLHAADEVNFLENPMGAAMTLENGAAPLVFHPFEVKTLRCQCDWR